MQVVRKIVMLNVYGSYYYSIHYNSKTVYLNYYTPRFGNRPTVKT